MFAVDPVIIKMAADAVVVTRNKTNWVPCVFCKGKYYYKQFLANLKSLAVERNSNLMEYDKKAALKQKEFCFNAAFLWKLCLSIEKFSVWSRNVVHLSTHFYYLADGRPISFLTEYHLPNF